MNEFTVSIIIGSIRPARMGDKVAVAIKNHMEKKGYKINLIDPMKIAELQTLKIPNQYNPNPSEEMKNVSRMLAESQGFLLVTPEYNHSFSGTIKNVIDNFMPEYSKKPFVIASYSAGSFGGIRANEALRPVISELGGFVVPTPFILPNVNEAFNESGEFKDTSNYARLDKLLEEFSYYLKTVGK